MKISLKAARVNADMTATEVSERMGCSRFTVYNWENGSATLPACEFMRLCELYNATPTDIFLPQKSTISRNRGQRNEA